MTKEDSSVHLLPLIQGWVTGEGRVEGAARTFMFRDNVTNLEFKLEKLMS